MLVAPPLLGAPPGPVAPLAEPVAPALVTAMPPDVLVLPPVVLVVPPVVLVVPPLPPLHPVAPTVKTNMDSTDNFAKTKHTRLDMVPPHARDAGAMDAPSTTQDSATGNGHEKNSGFGG